MLFVKKKPGAKPAADSAGFGLFIDKNAYSDDGLVIDLGQDSVKTVIGDAAESAGSASARTAEATASPDIVDAQFIDRPQEVKAEEGVAGLKIKRKSSAAAPTSSQPAGMSSLRAKFGAKSKDATAEESSPKKRAPFSVAGVATALQALFRPKPKEPATPNFSSSVASAEEPSKKSSIFARFGATQTSEAPAPAGDIPVAKKGLFGRKGPKDSADQSSTENTPKKKKDKKEKTGNFFGQKAIHLLVELDAGRRVFWHLTATEILPADEQQVKTAASFTSLDYRYLTPGALSYSAARDLALAEIGEECRVVNSSKKDSVVYATPATRTGQGYTLAPGPALIDKLLKKAESAESGQLVIGLLLEGSDSTASSMIILYHRNEQGEIGAPQVTVNPDNLEFTISQFASSKRMDQGEGEVVLFKNKELIELVGGLDAYPAEAEIYGIPLSKALGMATLACMVGTGFATTYATQAYVSKSFAQAKYNGLKSKNAKADRDAEAVISQALVKFAKTQSLDVSSVTERAAAVWVPNAKVVLEAVADRQRYDVHMPLTRGSFANRPSVLYQLSLPDVEPLVDMPAPEGCVKESPGVSGGLDAVQITFICETNIGPMSRYKLD